MDGNDFPHDIRERAFALGEKLVSAWKNQETAPEFERSAAQFRERMRSLILRRKQEWPYEYEFWKKHRGLKED